VHFPEEPTRLAPEPLRDWFVAQGITISFVPTPLAERLLALDWPLQGHLRILLTGADTLHRFPSPVLPFVLVNNYGPTECTVVATSGPVPVNPCPHTLPTIGRAIDNTQVYILDERLEPVPIGVVGELHIGGVGLARGYRNRPDLTKERFIPNPFTSDPGSRLYKTGDLGRFLPDGQIMFVGRADEQIKIRSFRIEPNEVVNVLNRHPMIGASCVIARETTPGDSRLIAYLVLNPKARLTRRTLQEFLQTQLPDYMIPGVFVLLEALPLTPNGKIDAAALPKPSSENSLGDAGFVAPRNPVEVRLAKIMAELLGMEEIGVDDNFFLLGGHSLLGTQVIARVRESFGVDVALRTLFDSPTVAKLGEEIERNIVTKLEAMSEEDAQVMLGALRPSGAGVEGDRS